MSKTTLTKILLLLFTYSIVLFHSAVPHCHAQDLHESVLPVSSKQHSCTNTHDHSEHGPHEHQVCQSDELHGEYLKAESDIDLPIQVDIPSLLVYFNLPVLLTKDNNDTPGNFERDIPVRSCNVRFHILRAPPAC